MGCDAAKVSAGCPAEAARDALCAHDADYLKEAVASLSSATMADTGSQAQLWRRLRGLLAGNALLAGTVSVADRAAMIDAIHRAIATAGTVDVISESFALLQTLLLSWSPPTTESPIADGVFTTLFGVVSVAAPLCVGPLSAAAVNLLETVVAFALSCTAVDRGKAQASRLLVETARALAATVAVEDAPSSRGVLGALAIALAALPPAVHLWGAGKSTDVRAPAQELCAALGTLSSPLVVLRDAREVPDVLTSAVLASAYAFVSAAAAANTDGSSTAGEAYAALSAGVAKLICTGSDQEDPVEGKRREGLSIARDWCAAAAAPDAEEGIASRMRAVSVQLAEAVSAAQVTTKGAVDTISHTLAALSTVFEDTNEHYGGRAAVARAVLLTPGLVSSLIALLGMDLTTADAPVGSAGAIFDVWVPLVLCTAGEVGCTPVDAADDDGRSSDSLSMTARRLFTSAFVLCGGPRSLCEFVNATRPVMGSTDGSEEARKWTSQLETPRLSAWRLLGLLPCVSSAACATVAFASAGPGAVAALLGWAAALPAAELQVLLSTSLSVEVLTTAFGLISGLSQRCATCCDGEARAALGEGETAESAVAQWLFPTEELLQCVATLVTCVAATGEVGAVAAGAEALSVLSRAHPYAATVVVDFDHLAESLELWKLAGEARQGAAAAQATEKGSEHKGGVEVSRVDAASAGGSLTARDHLTLGTLRVMTALVPRVPPAVNFEWIELLETAMLLLPFHRETPSGGADGRAITLRDVYAEAVLSCVLASAHANPDSREYLFEPCIQRVLADELRERYAEAAQGGARERQANDPIVTTILALAALFPCPVEAAVPQAIESLLPSGDGEWYSLSVPTALLSYLETVVDAMVDVVDGEDDPSSEQAERGRPLFNSEFIARAVDALVSLASSSLANKDPTMHRLLKMLEKRTTMCGPSAIVAFLRLSPSLPTGEALLRATPRVALAAASIQSMAMHLTDSGALRETLWDYTYRALVPYVDGTRSEEELLSPSYVLYCQELLTGFLAMARSPCAAPNLSTERGLSERIMSVEPSFLLAVAAAYERLAAVSPSSAAPTAAVALCSSLLTVVEALVVLMAADGTTGAWAALATDGWTTFASKVLLPNAGEPAVASTMLVLLSYPEVRGSFAACSGETHAQALAALEASVSMDPASRRLQLYAKDL